MADIDRQDSTQSETSGTRRSVDWGTHDSYWRDNYGARPYTQSDRAYEYYQPAYKYGHESAFFYGDRAWDQEVDGFFLAIGHVPNTKPFVGQIDLDPDGYILTKGGARTNIAGVFHAGDVQDRLYRQAITAAGAGCMAKIFGIAERDLLAKKPSRDDPLPSGQVYNQFPDTVCRRNRTCRRRLGVDAVQQLHQSGPVPRFYVESAFEFVNDLVNLRHVDNLASSN